MKVNKETDRRPANNKLHETGIQYDKWAVMRDASWRGRITKSTVFFIAGFFKVSEWFECVAATFAPITSSTIDVQYNIAMTEKTPSFVINRL